MSLEDLVSALASVIQAVAILVAGGWAYMKFVRGRTFRGRVRLELEARRWSSEHREAVLVDVAMTNEGLSRIDLSREWEKFVRVDALVADDWWPDLNVDWERSEPVMMTPLFGQHEWIEPHETIKDELLVPLGAAASGVLAYRIRARVLAPRVVGGAVGRALAARFRPERRGSGGWLRLKGATTWTADLVLPVGFAVEGREEVADGVAPA